MKFSKELVEKAKACQTSEEILALAKENEIELTREDAEALLEEFREGKLADEELDNIAGGAEGCGRNTYENVYWKRREDVQFLFNEGDYVEAFPTFLRHHTATCKVVERKISSTFDGYYDVYWLEKVPGCRTPFVKGNYLRSQIQKP